MTTITAVPSLDDVRAAIAAEVDALRAQLAADPVGHVERSSTVAAWAAKRPNGWHWCPLLTARVSRQSDGTITTRVVIALSRDFGATSNPNAPRGLTAERLAEINARAKAVGGLTLKECEALARADLDGDTARSDAEFDRVRAAVLSGLAGIVA